MNTYIQRINIEYRYIEFVAYNIYD